MRRILASALLLLAACCVAAAQTPANNQTEQELRRITRELASSTLHGDKAVVERYLADAYIETDGNGKVATRAQVLSNFPGVPKSMKPTVDIEDIQVHDYGNTAAVSYRSNFHFEVNGRKVSDSYRVTDVWLRRDARWQLIAEHYSQIPAERVAAKVDPKIYDAYVGQYEIAPDVVVTITREGDKLMEQQTGVKKKMELLPESETSFFSKGDTVKTIFVRDEKGQVTHIIYRSPDGQEIKVKKIR